MGLVSRIRRPQAASWAPTDDRWFMPGGSFYGGGMATQAGVSVDSDSAMRLMTVHNCVKVLYNCISQMPCQLMKEVAGVKSKATNHYMYSKLLKQPNAWMSSAEFFGMAIAHIALRGNFYCYKMGIPGRPIKELIPLKANMVTKVEQNEDFSLTYKIRLSDGTEKDFSSDEIMHFRGLVMNGYMGINPIEYARQSIGLGIASEQFLSQFFGKGLHPGAVIKHPLSLNAPAHANLRKNLKDKYEGLGKKWEFMLLDEAMGIDFPQIKLVDSQFLELGRFNEAQICGMFGIPLMMVQAGDNPTTYASATEFKRTFVDMTLAPIIVNFEQTMNRVLFTIKEQDQYYVKFNLNSLLRGNIAERFTAYQIGINSQILNPNECRSLEDYNAYEGGDTYETRTSTIKKDLEESDEKKNQ